MPGVSTDGIYAYPSGENLSLGIPTMFWTQTILLEDSQRPDIINTQAV